MRVSAKLIPVLMLTVLLLSAAAYAAGDSGAGDPAAGREKAKGCASCHGLHGKGRIPLAGKSAGYLAEQLRAYRSLMRGDETMNAIAKELNDHDIADLAAYYASQ
ncbi:MAG: c-type cytochrome [Gammaproteobacteria bacterium]|jgi:cytochrome c553